MAGPILSSSWYRVRGLKPRLRSHARLQRHRYRDEVWFVMLDPITGRSHRFTPSARFVINGMDGEHTVGELWEAASRQLGEAAPSQDELIQLLGQLHASDLLVSDVSPDVAELFERAQRQEGARLKRSIGNPMSIKIPLLDPDKLLERILRAMGPLWGARGVALWLAVVLPALLLVPPHWSELTGDVADRVLAAGNLAMIVLLFPLVKALHELGHGLATKAGGGEVHDMGVMLLVLMPVPYVDASTSNLFPSKRERALVGAAGVLVELFVAALAFYVWLLVEPGLVRAAAFDVMLIASVSTLVFNGNPLLRYDAYYVLADLIEIPNLAQRSVRYLGRLVERYAFGVRDEPGALEPAPGEKAWFVFYGIASFVYRIFVVVAIVLFVAGEFYAIGVVLAIWSVIAMGVLPVVKVARHLAGSPRLARNRRRVALVAGGALVVATIFVAFVPVPFRTQAEGILWLPEQALVRAGSNGFLTRFLVEPGTKVARGDALAESVDPALDAEIGVLEARVAELEAIHAAYEFTDRVRAAVAREQLDGELAALERALVRADGLIARSAGEGVFTVPLKDDQPGRYFKKGELIGYVIEPSRPRARVVVDQADVDAVRLATNRVELRRVERVGDVLAGRVVRQVPAGTDELPSRALSTEGGGSIAVDPRDPKGGKTLERMFQLEIDLEGEPVRNFGGRVYVRFDHVAEPLGSQWYRGLRRLFLSRFQL